ncbi:hypothetical protein BJY59DRAFT_180665 [Rhodotorula toruloides]
MSLSRTMGRSVLGTPPSSTRSASTQLLSTLTCPRFRLLCASPATRSRCPPTLPPARRPGERSIPSPSQCRPCERERQGSRRSS